jgi:glycosyltransferase XagB
MGKRARRAQPYVWARDQRPRDPSPQVIAREAIRARHALACDAPLKSAKTPAGRVMVAMMALVTCATLMGALGNTNFDFLWRIVSFGFITLGILRAIACFSRQKNGLLLGKGAIPEAAPIWTILIALYKEADSVPSLLAALSQLEWSPDRLDIIFACEADDAQTLQALSALQKASNFRIIRVPAGGPRTKPNALQTALPFARGRFLTVYDAEDRPDPQQLRQAFDAFFSGPANLAVVQAPLVTWNHNESWIAKQFALDYAIWFRVMLPAFARISGLIPLGGTSNHFRTDILRKAGGWDPYNVTEDADLGVRLGRLGFAAQLITAPTYEEAPPKISAWVKQRGRWIQGHIQTFSVHLRTPLSLSHEIGWRGLLAFFIGIGVGPMSALLILPFTLGLFSAFHTGVTDQIWIPFSIGMVSHILAACVACHRDGRWILLTSVLTLPLYYCLQSIAACRAIWRVVFTPSIWDKTDHGCAARPKKNKGDSKWIGQQLLPFSL